MRPLYLDASAVGHVILAQPGDRVPIRARARIVSSRILEVEILRAIDRFRILGDLSIAEAATKIAQLRDLLSRIDLLPVSNEVVARAATSFPVVVRALDAIHVASAGCWRRRLGPSSSGRTTSGKRKRP